MKQGGLIEQGNKLLLLRLKGIGTKIKSISMFAPSKAVPAQSLSHNN
jgi:hypothetical protein